MEIKNRDPRISYPGILGLPRSWDIISWDPGSSGLLGYQILGSWGFWILGYHIPGSGNSRDWCCAGCPEVDRGSRSIRPPGVGAGVGQGSHGAGWGGVAAAGQIRARAGLGWAGRQTIVCSAWQTWWPPHHHHPNSSLPPPLHPVMGTKCILNTSAQCLNNTKIQNHRPLSCKKHF